MTAKPLTQEHDLSPVYVPTKAFYVTGNDNARPTNDVLVGSILKHLEAANPETEFTQMMLGDFLALVSQDPGKLVGRDTIAQGGDGILNSVANVLLEVHDNPDFATETANSPRIIIVPTGRGNEVARNLDSAKSTQLVKQEQPFRLSDVTYKPVYPIELNFGPSQEDPAMPTHTVYALYCALIGNPAVASSILDSKSFRSHPMNSIEVLGRLREAYIAARCIVSPESFAVKIENKQHARTRYMSAIVALGAASAARYMSSQAAIDERSLAITEQPWFQAGILFNTLRMLTNRQPINPFGLIEGDTKVTYHFHPKKGPAIYSVDGQPYARLPEETQVEIGNRSNPIEMGVWRLAA